MRILGAHWGRARRSAETTGGNSAVGSARRGVPVITEVGEARPLLQQHHRILSCVHAASQSFWVEEWILQGRIHILQMSKPRKSILTI